MADRPPLSSSTSIAASSAEPVTTREAEHNPTLQPTSERGDSNIPFSQTMGASRFDYGIHCDATASQTLGASRFVYRIHCDAVPTAQHVFGVRSDSFNDCMARCSGLNADHLPLEPECQGVSFQYYSDEMGHNCFLLPDAARTHPAVGRHMASLERIVHADDAVDGVSWEDRIRVLLEGPRAARQQGNPATRQPTGTASDTTTFVFTGGTAYTKTDRVALPTSELSTTQRYNSYLPIADQEQFATKVKTYSPLHTISPTSVPGPKHTDHETPYSVTHDTTYFSVSAFSTIYMSDGGLYYEYWLYATTKYAISPFPTATGSPYHTASSSESRETWLQRFTKSTGTYQPSTAVPSATSSTTASATGADASEHGSWLTTTNVVWLIRVVVKGYLYLLLLVIALLLCTIVIGASMEAIKPGSCEALTGVEYASSAAVRGAPSGGGPKKSAELDGKEYVYVGGKDIKAQGKLEGR